MKKISLLFLFMIHFQSGFSQLGFKPLVKEETIGYTKGKQPIRAKHYTFSKSLDQVFADTANEKLVLVFREENCCPKKLSDTGYIYVYHKAADSLIWSYPINFERQDCYVYNSILFVTASDTTLAYHIGKERVLWKKPVSFSFYDFSTAVFVGFETGSERQATNRFVALNVETGTEKWHQIIDPTLVYYKESVYSDSVFVTISDSLYVRRFTDGIGWSYPISTFLKMEYTTPDYVRTWAQEKGIYYRRYIRDDKEIAHELHSEVVLDSIYIYLATATEVVKIRHKTGEVIWKIPLPEKMGSTSRLVLRDSILWMINYGIGNFRESTHLIGKPFLAKINAESGRLYYSWQRALKKKRIIGYDFREKHLNLFCLGQVLLVNYETGEVFKSRKLRKKNGVYPWHLHLQSQFHSSDTLHYKAYSETYKDGSMFTIKGEALVLDQNLQTVKEFKLEEGIRRMYGLKTAEILKNKNEYILVDTTGKRFGSIKMSLAKKYYENGQFYLYEKKEVIEFGWKDVFPGDNKPTRYMWSASELIKTFGF